MIVIKRLEFSYKLSAFYSSPITDHRFYFRFLPRDTSRQKIEDADIFIANCHKYDIITDAYGNRIISGYIGMQHARFDLTMTGSAITGLDVYEDSCDSGGEAAPFRGQTALTAPGQELLRLYDELRLDRAKSAYEAALYLTDCLQSLFRYSPGMTEIGESAEAAFRKGGGVCQDYTHIMLSLLRHRGIAARYAAGMLMGEGASHAWAEVFCSGYWYGFDPTNRKLTNDEYIRVSCGKDAADCVVISGTMSWGAVQTQQEHLIVRERKPSVKRN